MSVFLLFTWSTFMQAQQADESDYINTPENKYALLLNQVSIYASLDSLNFAENRLLDQADNFAQQGEFEIAVVYLEEILASLTNPKVGQIRSSHSVVEHEFSFSILSGMDFNRQEFEIGYLESDSTLLEEINKPYVGIRLNYLIPTGIESQFEVSSELRYDKENLRNYYKLGWRKNNYTLFSYSGFWNESDFLSTNSFWEHEIEARIGSGWLKKINWSVYNMFTIKDYKNTSTYIADFYRNRFSAYLEWNIPGAPVLSFDLLHELNESLGRNDNDYAQATIRPGFRQDFGERFNLNIQPELLIRDYKLEYEDSTIVNRYFQFGSDLKFEIPIYKSLRLEVDDEFYLKKYRTKSTLEPDYSWNTMRNFFVVDLNSSFDVGIGYEWEFKYHNKNSNGLYDVSEQNFNAHGISLLMNYFSMSGMYFSATVTYQWRRYPSSVTNDLFSIYSDRNIFSIMLMTFIPLAENLFVNGFITYDNDVDIDLDQQNNQSTIFMAELEYKF